MNDHTIILKGHALNKEGVCTETMLPGHFVVSIPSDNEQTGSLAFPATAGAVAQGIMREYDIEGQGVTDAYAANDIGLYAVMSKGSEVLARVAAGAAAIAAGAPLRVQTDGTVLTATVGTHHVVATAMEAVDNSGGGTEVFIKVEIV